MCEGSLNLRHDHMPTDVPVWEREVAYRRRHHLARQSFDAYAPPHRAQQLP